MLSRRVPHFSRTREQHPSRPQQSCIINIAALLCSSALICILTLLFAIGVFYYSLFYSYFSHPLLLLLNWLPILFLQLLLLCLLNRQWAAFLLNALVFVGASIGHFFKMKFRNEPFFFADLHVLRAGLSVAGNYELQFTSRILFAIVCVLTTTLLLLLFARGCFRLKQRLAVIVFLGLLIYPLWSCVYSNEKIYSEKTENLEYADADLLNMYFASKGFVYPFIYSIKEVLPPEGYNRREAQEILAEYSDSDIPDDRRISILALQLESFCDLEAIGFSDIDPDAYRILHQLEQESLHGTMVAHVTGGGTCTSEYCFLTGTYGGLYYHSASPTYVRYLSEQGYITIGNHPNKSEFYNRKNVNEFFGFQQYYYLDGYYEALTGGRWYCDDVLLPEVFRQYRELTGAGEDVFSFTVTLQGHGGYNADSYNYDRMLWNGSGSPETSHVLNNFLGSLYQTQELLLEQLEAIRGYSVPTVVVLYGDHTPFLWNQSVYDECGVSFNMSTEDGFLRFYGTPYLIWANDAAKSLLENDFVGEMPTISPGYLMNLVFHEIGWKGPSFMRFTDTIMEHLPVASVRGYYIEDSVFTRSLSSDGQKLLHNYECVQYYYRDILHYAKK